METLDALVRRVEAFELDSLPHSSAFVLNSALGEKVQPGTGELRPFFGSTVAYYLDPGTLDLVEQITDALHRHHGDALADRLPLHQAHVTLHDLRASERPDEVAAAILRDEPAAVAALHEARAVGTVSLDCVAVFNLVSMSIAIGLRPSTDDDHERLLRARGLFDPIVPAGPFTPHITLAYYRPEPSAPIDADRLRTDLHAWTEAVRGRRVSLHPDRLHLLGFDSMLSYWVSESTS